MYRLFSRPARRGSVALEAAMGAVILAAVSSYGLQAYQDIAIATDLKRMATTTAEAIAKLEVTNVVGDGPSGLPALGSSVNAFMAANGPVRAIAHQYLAQYGGAPDDSRWETSDVEIVQVEAALLDFRKTVIQGQGAVRVTNALDRLAEEDNISHSDLARELGTSTTAVQIFLTLAESSIDDVQDLVDTYASVKEVGDIDNSDDGTSTAVFSPRFVGDDISSTGNESPPWTSRRPGESGTCLNPANALTLQNVRDGGVFEGLDDFMEDSSISANSDNPNVLGETFLSDHVQMVVLVRACLRLRNRAPFTPGSQNFEAFHMTPVSDYLFAFDVGSSDVTPTTGSGGDSLQASAQCWLGLEAAERTPNGMLHCLSQIDTN